MRALLGAQLQQAEIGDLVFSPVALAPLAFAQELAGWRGASTRVFVQPKAGADAEVERELRRIAGSTG